MPTIRISEEAYKYLNELIPKIEEHMKSNTGISKHLTVGDAFNLVIQYYREKPR